MTNPQTRDRRDERGVVMVLVALAMTALLLFGALAVDVGAVWASRTQSQNVDDAAVLAAAKSMIKQSPVTGTTVDQPGAILAAKDVAAANATVGNPSVKLRDEDIVFGRWNATSRQLETGVNVTNPNVVTGVRVNVVMDGAPDGNRRSPSFFSQLLGRNGFDVRNTATAYLGFAGAWEAHEGFDLPIVIDSWNLTFGETCSDEAFCDTVDDRALTGLKCSITAANRQSHDDEDDVTCLRFSDAETYGSRRIACWTSFDASDLDEDDLLDLVDNGNPADLKVGDKIDLEDQLSSFAKHNEVMTDIGQRFYGEGPYAGEPRGLDEYTPKDGRPDSWVVKLPVVESMNGHHCRGAEGDPAMIKGSVCFEIREVEYGDPGEISRIKGNFLCPNSSNSKVRALYNAHCRTDGGGAGPGGCNYGMRAARAVLVE